MKIIISENKVNEIVIKWLNKNYGDLEVFETEKTPNHIFYKKKDDIIFYYDKKNRKVVVNYDGIWSDMDNYFKIDDLRIMSLLKIWLKEQYNLIPKRIKIGWEMGEIINENKPTMTHYKK